MNCTHCSAKIPGDALTCQYCGHETPNFAKHRAEENEKKRHAHQLSLADAEKARQAQLSTLAGGAKTAFIWSLVGVGVCCLPFASVVGLIMGVSVRKRAAALNVPAPGQAMAAIIIGASTMGLWVLALIIGIIADHQKSERVAALQGQMKTSAVAAELDPATACALAEIALLEGGAGQAGGNLALFRCEGALEKRPDGTVVMKDLEYTRSSGDAPERVDGCFSKGSRWKVDGIGTGPGCRDGRDGGE